MAHQNRFKIEWGLSLLNKYGIIVIENELRDFNLTKTQGLFIIHLGNQPEIHQDQLSAIFKTNRSTVTRAMNDLEKQGLIQKKADKLNKKANLISLTDKGTICLKHIYLSIQNWIDIITCDFTKEEIDLSQKLITRMASNACKHLGDSQLSTLITKE